MGATASTYGVTKDYISFTINEVPYKVCENDVPAGTSLNTYIRDHAHLRGTKAMCHEGGCGVCIVAVNIKDKMMAVNSCLVPILICDGWAIHTIEGIGNKQDGYHKIQAKLAVNNGSQCGYCSPGMVMNLYSLIEKKQATMQEIENSFAGNICRCTGYRAILDMAKSFASDAPATLKKDIYDIEELYKIKTCPKNGLPCTNGCSTEKLTDNNSIVNIKLKGAEFYKVYSIEDLFGIFLEKQNSTYILNGGNTAHGVYRTTKSDLYIDINNIADLNRIEKTNEYLTLGGNVTLTVAIETFKKYSSDKGFKYLQHLAEHIDLIANVPVRNIGTMAGNLMIKHTHHEFPSDLFLILETAGAQIHILDKPSNKQSMVLLDFLKIDMRHKIIYSIVLPALSSEYEYRSYKIMPRAQNAHAYVNAGFLFKLDGGGKVLEKPNIIFGGINPNFLHATKTEEFLMNKSILDKNVLKSALETLSGELNPDHVLPDYSPEFRKLLAEGLFYKFMLSIRSEDVNSRLRSGGTILKRELSSAMQDWETDKNEWPINKPIPKLEAIHQTSGEAQFFNDIPPYPDEIFCAFVLTDIGNGKIQSIDTSKALGMDGVLAFFTAKDITGKNLVVSAASQLFMMPDNEPLFVEEDVAYAGQPVGVIVAETHNLANEAAKLVEIKYSDALKRPPVLTIEDAISTQDNSRFMQSIKVPAKGRGNNSTHVIKGVFQCGEQYHYTMETQGCLCIPLENGMDVYPTSQWTDLTQIAIADCLGMKHNSINVHVKRLGGGYGAKISRNAQIACACALACYKMNRPARFITTIESNMLSQGKRNSTRQEYEVGVDENGVIQYLESTHWSNNGNNYNEAYSFVTVSHIQNCYNYDNWAFNAFEVKTDMPPNTFARGPGSVEGTGMIENIIEHIARVTGKDPTQVRLSNMNDKDRKVLEPMIKDFSKTSDYDIRKRAVEIFNSENRWKKKGISLMAMKYPQLLWGGYNSMVSICARDGTVCVTHGGIECGQGINTKVAQAAAYTLGCELELVTVKPTTNLAAPNNSVTGGSITSECCVYATIASCKIILERLEPIKKQLKNPSWQELVFTAYSKEIDLCARYLHTTLDGRTPYDVYGITIAEVEVDLLTGQHIIRRLDVLEDAGTSMNPLIDVGQVEGALIMGIGYWTCEDLMFDPKTGVLLTNRTWNYKPPGAKDIPVDFRVTLKKNSPNPVGVLRSKAIGEPPLCMSCTIPIAIRYALNSSRAECENKDAWYRLDAPVTTERILLSSLTNKDNMML